VEQVITSKDIYMFRKSNTGGKPKAATEALSYSRFACKITSLPLSYLC